MYDITCFVKNSSIEYFNMGIREVNEIVCDCLDTYVLKIKNNKTNKEYMILNKQSLKEFYNSEKIKEMRGA